MKRSIFYLDHDASHLELFQDLFDGEYNVQTATTPEDARRFLADCLADIIIISDRTVPRVEETEFLRNVARMCPLSVRIMVSGHVRFGSMLNEVSAGVINIFLPKPWTEEQMRRALERAKLILDSASPPLPPPGEQRIAPRHKIKIETRVLLVVEREVEAEVADNDVLLLTGYTHDISDSGLALIISEADMAALSMLDKPYRLRLMLTLPTGPVELSVTPVRHQPFGPAEKAEFLVGTQISDMSGRDRVRFIEYIRDLAARPQP